MKIVILNNIRSNENVGSIFRTCDAAGVAQVILTGYTPAPIDKFGRINKALAKSALGAEKTVSWEKVLTLKKAIGKLPGFKIVAVEQDKNSINYKKLPDYLLPTTNCCLIFGNEVTGLTKKELGLCDQIVEIPMHGKKESLNVSVSAGIVLFSLI